MPSNKLKMPSNKMPTHPTPWLQLPTCGTKYTSNLSFVNSDCLSNLTTFVLKGKISPAAWKKHLRVDVVVYRW